MKRNLVIVSVLALVLWVNAMAITDPDPDSIGIYFDQNADVADILVGPSVPFIAYVIITYPTEQEISGFEFGYNFHVPAGREASFYRLINDLPEGATDMGNNGDPLNGDYVVALAEPLPDGSTVIVVTWMFMLLENFAADLYLEAADNSIHGNGYPSYDAQGSSIGLKYSGACWGDGNLVAMINTFCPMDVESSSFGSVKSLYR